ncbi:hypothetical protein [Aquisalibacillus elongatus]|uniref:WYL domain-containing protein n=1 Tax=Aquisalibacillus elongatus TaxID=485577 RepID=A0A3N5B434_9BACI|nr:hypothetical protein [Aquisalibacillus elongatus]RPF52164.1 hypothetical protein EDC24_2154 [Aquisalibacillus elongatus]
MDNLLRRALDNKQKLEMIYLSEKGEYSQRVVRIVEVKEHVFLAFCYTKRAVRRFKKVQVLSILPYKKGKQDFA